MKVIIFAILFVFVNAKQFSVLDKKNMTCASVRLDGQLDITAINGTTQVNKTLPFSGATLNKAASDCSVIKLMMKDSIQVWFQLDSTAGAQKVQPIAAFEPKDVVPDGDNKTVVFNAVEFGSFMSNQSFKCIASLQHIFKTSAKTSLQYDVTATTTNLEIQFGDVKNNTFSTDKVECPQDIPTTTPSKPTTSMTPTTPAPADDTLHVNVTNGNDTCILLEGDFVVSVKHENQSMSWKVPSTALASGNCTLNKTTSMIKVSYMKDMNMAIYFLKSNKDETSVYQIEVTYDASIFNASQVAQPDPKTVKITTADDFLKATSEGYYQCNSNTTLMDNVSNVTLTSANLKYKAFNKGTDVDFSGNVAQCPADEETSSVVPIAVGAALAGLVVIVLIAYLIGRRRSRKSGYESV